jgi:hypothetical protein
MNRYISIAGGLLVAISMFLPFISAAGISIKGTALGGVGYFYIVLGLIIALVGFVDKRWLNIISLLFGLIVAALAIKYSGDASDNGGSAQIGIWIMLIGGLVSMVGAVMGMIKKPAATAK